VSISWLAAASPLAAQDYCSLKVRVLTPKGERPEALVAVQERNGRNLEKEQGLSDDVQFCDLGLLPVTVVVGLKGCNQIVVNDVPLSWREPYLLTVTWDFEPCLEEKPPAPVPVCEVLFRVSGPDGRWLDKATVSFDAPTRPPLQTDSSGRARTLISVDQRLEGSVSVPGNSPKKFSVGCSRSEPIHEEMVTLGGQTSKDARDKRDRKSTQMAVKDHSR